METDLQKKSHTVDKLQHEGQSLMDSVDTGKDDIDSQLKAIKERWDKVNNGQWVFFFVFSLSFVWNSALV